MLRLGAAPFHARTPSSCTVLVLLGAGCTQLTSFDLSVAEEASEALCADGADNDADGLMDCQDWKCLGFKTCCDTPAVVVEDDFAHAECASQSCGEDATECAPNPENWVAWGSPLPLLCEEGLSPHKTPQCYDVGVLSKDAFDLRPGLSVKVGLEGAPESKGFLSIALTLQDKIGGALDDCAPATTVLPIAEVRQVYTKAGYRLEARFDELLIGVSPKVMDEKRHVVRLWIEENRLIHYALDDVEFALSPKNVALTETLTARLALSGRGLTARFADAQVVAGAQCETPAGWKAVKRFVSLDVGWKWDSGDVFRPSILRQPNGRLNLYYMGCSDLKGSCDLERTGLGLATANVGTGFLRTDETDEKPLFYPADYESKGTHRTLPDFALVRQEGSATYGYLSADLEPRSILHLSSTDGRHWSGPKDSPAVLEPGPRGAWDDEAVCCATAAVRGSEVYLWYAGQDRDDHKWRIGLATSRDGRSFVKSSANPVLIEGSFGDYDGHGATDPEVVWDDKRRMFRMWYKAEPYSSSPSIAYAVSPDGIVWHKSPQNPVVASEDLGEMGSPSVLWDDGRLRMWIEASGHGANKLRIFSFENHGMPFESSEGAP